MKIRATLAAIGIALTVAVGGVSSPAAAAGQGCGSTCEGQDPSTFRAYFDGLGYTCAADARGIHIVGAPDDPNEIELKYSPRCRTAWVTGTYDGYNHYLQPYRIESWTTSGTRRKTYKQYVGKNWTPMVNDAGLLARACYYDIDTEVSFLCSIKY